MSRLSQLRAILKEKNLGGMLVTDPCNIAYLSGFSFTDGYLLVTEKSAALVTDSRYIEAAGMKADPAFFCTVPDDRKAFMKDFFAKEGVQTVGFEGESLTYSALSRQKDAHPELTFADAGDPIARLRLVKDEGEIETIRKAQQITDAAFSHILTVLNPNMTEIEVAAELEYFMRKNGADGAAFETVAVSGTAASMPHGVPRPVKLERGFLTMDFGAKLDGYCSDMTRTVSIGTATAEMKNAYSAVLSAQRAGLAAVAAGADSAAVDAAARVPLDAAYPRAFGHALGHGVGLYIHEEPRLSPRPTEENRVLRAGEIVTVEPGVYLAGKWGLRIEDMVVVREGGAENLTKSDKNLIEIL